MTFKANVVSREPVDLVSSYSNVHTLCFENPYYLYLMREKGRKLKLCTYTNTPSRATSYYTGGTKWHRVEVGVGHNGRDTITSIWDIRKRKCWLCYNSKQWCPPTSLSRPPSSHLIRSLWTSYVVSRVVRCERVSTEGGRVVGDLRRRYTQETTSWRETYRRGPWDPPSKGHLRWSPV